jgi:hypothetical protein
MKQVKEFFIRLGIILFFGITMVASGSLVLLFSLLIAIKGKRVGSKMFLGKWEFEL